MSWAKSTSDGLAFAIERCTSAAVARWERSSNSDIRNALNSATKLMLSAYQLETPGQ